MRFFLINIFLFLSLALIGQEGEARISKTRLTVGNRVELIYSVELKKDDKIKFKRPKGNFPAKVTSENSTLQGGEFNEIEILSFKDTIVFDKNQKTWIGVFELCPWDSGLVVLEGLRFILNDKMGVFPSTYLQCDLVPHKKGKDFFDIKETFLEVPTQKDWLYYGTIYVFWWLIPVLIYLIYRWRNKAKTKPIIEKQEISLKKKIMLAIDALEKAEMWKKDRMKEHFVELSYILRSYLTARYSLNLLDKTTYETKLLLKAKNIDKEVIDSILRILNHADMVKFADSKPGDEVVENSFFIIRQLVTETSPIEYNHAE